MKRKMIRVQAFNIKDSLCTQPVPVSFSCWRRAACVCVSMEMILPLLLWNVCYVHKKRKIS